MRLISGKKPGKCDLALLLFMLRKYLHWNYCCILLMPRNFLGISWNFMVVMTGFFFPL